MYATPLYYRALALSTAMNSIIVDISTWLFRHNAKCPKESDHIQSVFLYLVVSSCYKYPRTRISALTPKLMISEIPSLNTWLSFLPMIQKIQNQY